MIDYDLELRRHQEVFRRAYSIRPADQVLDIGCGAGATTREAGHAARDGRVLGIDSSAQMIEQARALTAAEGLGNVEYACADVSAYPLSPHSVDIAISRFGTMFFAEPGQAFAAIHAALRPSGRLVMMVWQARERNEWAVEIARAVAGGRALPDNTASAQAFSLGDPSAVEQLLTRAGFADVTFDEVHEPVCYGADVDSAFAFVSPFLLVQEALDATNRQRSLAQLRGLLEAHRTSAGVCFDSRAWIVAARRS